MKTISIIAVLILQLIMSSICAQKSNQTIEVNIENIQTNDGNIMIGLYKNQQDFLSKTYKAIQTKAKKGTIQVTFEDVEPGIYAISLYHDQDTNQKLNTFLMIPTEPYGISNNAKSQFGPPQWIKAKFSISDKKVVQNISL